MLVHDEAQSEAERAGKETPLRPYRPSALRSYALAIMWHERSRFVPGVLAVACSSVLINLQCGLLLGLFAATSVPIDHADAEIWVGSPGVTTLDLGRPISEDLVAYVAEQPEVASFEPLLLDFAPWVKPDRTKELCIVIGSRLDENALGAVRELTPELRGWLTEPGSIVVDDAELDRLGMEKIGDTAEIYGHRVRLVGLVHGLKSLTAPYVFCSLLTARMLLPLPPEHAVYFLARCRNAGEARSAVQRLSECGLLSAYTKEQFSRRTRLHWLVKTNAGITAGFTAALGLLVGALVTSQALYSATAASMREYAVLRALGISRARLGHMVMVQSLCVGFSGVVLGLPAAFAMGRLAEFLGTRVNLSAELLVVVALMMLATAFGSGLTALRALRHMEPAALLR
jgi:putative ABC transport system permease protein